MKLKSHHRLTANEFQAWKEKHPLALTQESFDAFNEIEDKNYQEAKARIKRIRQMRRV